MSFWLLPVVRIIKTCSRLENWQAALRKQYQKRDPNANPLGTDMEEIHYSRATTSDIEHKEEDSADGHSVADDTDLRSVKDELETDQVASNTSNGENLQTSKEKDVDGYSPSPKAEPNDLDDKDVSEEASRIKDWSDLSMMEKLESMHTLVEWHFQNPTRLRSIMRSDDEYASWVRRPSKLLPLDKFSSQLISVLILLVMTQRKMHIGS